MCMKTLVLANQKGGVGKTAVGCQLAYYFAQLGRRTLYLELDHQQNSAHAIIRSGKAALAHCTASQLLQGELVPLPAAPFVLVPGDDGLGALERQPERHNSYVNALQQFLLDVAQQFDVCVIDTNPNPDIRYAAALITADFLLSPVQLNQEAIDGIAALLGHARYGYRKIKQLLNPKLELIGILPNLVEPTQFQRDNLAQLVASFHSLLIPLTQQATGGYAYIPTRTAIAEAQAAGVPLWQLRHAAGGRAEPGAVLPVRSAAREAWREIRPVFDEIARRMGMVA